jgi:DNA-binding response OmpR family regulator
MSLSPFAIAVVVAIERFGDVLIDTEGRQLWRNGASVHVSLKAFDLLSLLIRHRPVAISKSDIQEHLWPSTFVTEDRAAHAAGDAGNARQPIGLDQRP